MTAELKAEGFLNNPTALRAELESLGALSFEPQPSGLFVASAIPDTDLAELTRMNMAWFRDNAHLAEALARAGTDDDIQKARGVGAVFLKILHRNEGLLNEAIADPGAPRLPVRVDANTLANDTEPRIQNDSSGYAMWLPARLMLKGLVPVQADDLAMMALVARYLEAGEYWRQPDEGAWEEDRRVHASSVGVVIASLRTVSRLFAEHGYRAGINFARLIGRGVETLDDTIWSDGETPPDTTSNYPGRFYDMSQLLPVVAMDLFDGNLAAAGEIVDRVESKLVRDIGVIRYLGDSYYAPGFTTMLQPGERTSQAEGRLERRNTLSALTQQGEFEAQWTLGDPLISEHHGRRYELLGWRSDRSKQIQFINRALAQYIPVGDGQRVPELFYKESPESTWTPNDHIPLLWAQANMLRAILQLAQTR